MAAPGCWGNRYQRSVLHPCCDTRVPAEQSVQVVSLLQHKLGVCSEFHVLELGSGHIVSSRSPEKICRDHVMLTDSVGPVIQQREHSGQLVSMSSATLPSPLCESKQFFTR